MTTPVPEELKVAILEHEVARLRQSVVELEAKLRKPTLLERLGDLLKDYPNMRVIEQRQLAATIIFVLRKKLGVRFSNLDPEDVSIVMIEGGHLCATFKDEIVIKGDAGVQGIIGLRSSAERAAA